MSVERMAKGEDLGWPSKQKRNSIKDTGGSSRKKHKDPPHVWWNW